MTMSTSSAPCSTTHRTSSSFASSGDWPDGNAVATDATFTLEPSTRATADGTGFGYTQIAATDGTPASLGSGRIAFEASASTLPGVSWPSSVVRSIMRTASSSANTFASRLIERFASDAARSSSATASTEPIRGSLGSSGSSNPRGRTGACAMKLSVAPGRLRNSAPVDRSELHEQLFADSWNEDLGLHRSNFAFRGRLDAEDDLSTSLARLGGAAAAIERPLLRHFRKYAARDAVPVDSTWNWLALAQHHGLPTRLLDWTYSPYVALHFATARTDGDGAVWMVDYVRAHELAPSQLREQLEQEGAYVFTTEMIAAVAEDFDDLAKLGDDYVVFVEPPSDLTRKLIVPAALKWEVRDKLDQANVTERVLFPGLDGLSRWLSRYYMPIDRPTRRQTRRRRT